MNFKRKNIEWALILICILLFILIAIGVHYDKFINFDKTIYNFISNLNIPLEYGFWKTITYFASPLFIIITLVILIFVISNKVLGGLLFINTVNTFIINQGLKFIFSRPRPLELMLIEETGYSFPSGHTMMALAFYGFLIYIIWQMNISKKSKKILTILLVILILLIGISRIYLGVHYPSDVIAGFVITLAYLIIFIKIVKKYELRRKENEKSI